MSSNLEKKKLQYIDLLLCLAGAGGLAWLASFGDQPSSSLAGILRLLLSVAYVFGVPGYLLQVAFFPHQAELSGIGRLGLSFGLSVSLIPPVALILDRTPWGLKPWPIAIAWLGLVGVLISIAGARRWQQFSTGEAAPHFDLSLPQAWAAESKTGRVLLGVAAVSLVTALAAGIALAFTPNPADRFTEFYTLGPGSMAEDYPRTAVSGQPIFIIVGLRNHEGQAVDYSVRASLASEQLYQSGVLHIEDRAAVELIPAITFPNPGQDQELILELFREGTGTPYRTLRLFIDVEAEGVGQ